MPGPVQALTRKQLSAFPEQRWRWQWRDLGVSLLLLSFIHHVSTGSKLTRKQWLDFPLHFSPFHTLPKGKWNYLHEEGLYLTQINVYFWIIFLLRCSMSKKSSIRSHTTFGEEKHDNNYSTKLHGNTSEITRTSINTATIKKQTKGELTLVE